MTLGRDLLSWFFHWFEMSLSPSNIVPTLLSLNSKLKVQIGFYLLLKVPVCLKLVLSCCPCKRGQELFLIYIGGVSYANTSLKILIFIDCSSRVGPRYPFLLEMKNFFSALQCIKYCMWIMNTVTIFPHSESEILFDTVCHWVRISNIWPAL